MYVCMYVCVYIYIYIYIYVYKKQPNESVAHPSKARARPHETEAQHVNRTFNHLPTMSAGHQ